MAEIVWLPEVPDEVRGAAEPSIMRWRAALPSWCHALRISFAEEPERGEACHIDVLPQYRTATITICPGWLTEPPEGRDELLGHEVMHVVTAAMTDWVGGVLTDHVEDDALRDRLAKEWADRFETVTSDLAYTIRPLLAPPERAPLKVA